VKQDLRDKLLKAGLVDKKTKKRADHRARLKRTEDAKKGVDAEAVQAQKDRAFEKKVEEQRQRDRERELARHRQQQERERKQTAERTSKAAAEKHDSAQLDRKYKARNLLQTGVFLPQAPGPVAFHFVSRSGGIRKLHVSTHIAHDLKSGQLAIAQFPGAERFGLVRRDVAKQLLSEDPTLVRFFIVDPEEELAEPPPVVEDQPPKSKGTAQRFEPPGKGQGNRRDRDR
jgi:uncharacterized protein YaiL (DUF2058 family)